MRSTERLETCKGGFAVTPGTPYTPARALWIGGTGDVTVAFPDGGSATFFNVTGLLPVESKEVLAAGTTATNITAML